MSSSNRVDLRYVAELTYAVTPATPALKLLRMTGEGLNANIATAQSAEIRNDRNDQDVLVVGESAGGSVDCELSHTSFDDWLEGVMCSAWVVDGIDTNKFTMVNGLVEKSFSIQMRFQDISQYLTFIGSKMNTFRMTVGPKKITTATWGVMARHTTRTGVAIVGATYPVGPTTRPYTGSTDVDIMNMDGTPLTVGLSAFSLNLNNNYREQNVIGMLGANALVAGKFEATGDYEVYFATGSDYDKFLANSAFAFAISMVDDVGNRMRVDLPRAKFETGEIVAQGNNTDVMFRGTYRALFDATTGGSVKLTKDAT